jgi:hypothetical protein
VSPLPLKIYNEEYILGKDLIVEDKYSSIVSCYLVSRITEKYNFTLYMRKGIVTVVCIAVLEDYSVYFFP